MVSGVQGSGRGLPVVVPPVVWDLEEVNLLVQARPRLVGDLGSGTRLVVCERTDPEGLGEPPHSESPAFGPEPGVAHAGVPSTPVVVPRWIQLVMLPLALLALWALAKAAGKVLVIFIVASVIALILNPAVAFVQRGRLPRRNDDSLWQSHSQ